MDAVVVKIRSFSVDGRNDQARITSSKHISICRWWCTTIFYMVRFRMVIYISIFDRTPKKNLLYEKLYFAPLTIFVQSVQFLFILDNYNVT